MLSTLDVNLLFIKQETLSQLHLILVLMIGYLNNIFIKNTSEICIIYIKHFTKCYYPDNWFPGGNINALSFIVEFFTAHILCPALSWQTIF